jgi:hypothetical protein
MHAATAAESQRASYFAWRRDHPTECAFLDDIPPDVVGSLWAAAWKAGSWDGIRRNSTLGLNLSQIIQRLEELAVMYGDVQVERALAEEVEQQSAYWSSGA